MSKTKDILITAATLNNTDWSVILISVEKAIEALSQAEFKTKKEKELESYMQERNNKLLSKLRFIVQVSNSQENNEQNI